MYVYFNQSIENARMNLEIELFVPPSTQCAKSISCFKILCFPELNVAKVHFQECCPLPLCGCWSVMKFTDVRSELRLAQAEEAPEAAMRLP